MSTLTKGASRSPAMDGRHPTPVSSISANPALLSGAADIIRRQLADLEFSLARASARLMRSQSDLTTDEVEQLRVEVRNQRAALAALMGERKAEPKPAFVGAGHFVLKGMTAWSVALPQSA